LNYGGYNSGFLAQAVLAAGQDRCAELTLSSQVNTLESVRECNLPLRSRLALIIAHRGASGDAPENTIEAFELAWQRGADGIEFDIHFSSDEMPVVIHDPCLDRTTSSAGRVRDYTAEVLQRLDAGSWFNERYPSKARPQYQGLKIPLLSETLDWVRKRNCRAFLEIKEGSATYPGIESVVIKEVFRARVADQTTIISFDLATLQRCRALNPSIALGIDLCRPLRALANARSISAVTLHPHWVFVSPRFVKCAHQSGFQVLAWGLDTEESIRRTLTSGIDGLMTDDPGYAVKLRGTLWPKPRSASA
jgi:glycerophosphoryl diester phosphodiesterase